MKIGADDTKRSAAIESFSCADAAADTTSIASAARTVFLIRPFPQGSPVAGRVSTRAGAHTGRGRPLGLNGVADGGAVGARHVGPGAGGGAPEGARAIDQQERQPGFVGTRLQH